MSPRIHGGGGGVRVANDHWRWRSIVCLRHGHDPMRDWSLDSLPAADVEGQRVLNQARKAVGWQPQASGRAARDT